MRGKRVKLLMQEARERAMDGQVIASREYDRLKKAHNTHSQNPKLTTSKRTQRNGEIRHYNWFEERVRKSKARRRTFGK